MQISELKTKIEEGNSIQDLIEVKQYLSIIEKQLIANKIIDSCIVIDDESNLYKIDYFYKKLTSDVSFLVNYTNLEFSENLIKDYDYLAENVGIELILDQIPINEVEFILDLVDFELAQIVKLNNSIEGILANRLQALINKVPDEKGIKKLMTEAQKQINKIKPENLEILKGLVGQGEGDKIDK